MRKCLATMITFGALVACGESGFAQTPIATVTELTSHLGAGDAILVTTADGSTVAGRVRRVGTADMEVENPRRGAPPIAIPFDTIRSLERRRDPVRNGVFIGAVVGASFAGSAFFYALAVDRNELDEWAPFYAGMGAVSAGLGAVIGWAIDGARSKPPLIFERASARRSITLKPLLSGAHGLTVDIRF